MYLSGRGWAAVQVLDICYLKYVGKSIGDVFYTSRIEVFGVLSKDTDVFYPRLCLLGSLYLTIQKYPYRLAR